MDQGTVDITLFGSVPGDEHCGSEARGRTWPSVTRAELLYSQRGDVAPAVGLESRTSSQKNILVP